MKTQEEMDAIRADYKKQWDTEIRRMEAKLAFYQGFLDATIEAARSRDIRLVPEPGELFPGEKLKAQVAELEENIAFRKLQWELIQDEFEAADKVRIFV